MVMMCASLIISYHNTKILTIKMLINIHNYYIKIVTCHGCQVNQFTYTNDLFNNKLSLGYKYYG